MDSTAVPEKKTTIWTHNFICVFIVNAMLSLAHSSVNTLVSTYATYLGAGAVVMGILTGLFFRRLFCVPAGDGSGFRQVRQPHPDDSRLCPGRLCQHWLRPLPADRHVCALPVFPRDAVQLGGLSHYDRGGKQPAQGEAGFRHGHLQRRRHGHVCHRPNHRPEASGSWAHSSATRVSASSWCSFSPPPRRFSR